MNKTFKVITIASASIIGFFLLVIILFFSWMKMNSPAKTASIKDPKGEIVKGSIAEIQHLNLNGIDQFVLIRGKSLDNPVLLMVHGGPGSPQVHMNCKYNKELEDRYIVVNWDQRGAGASYYDSISPENMSIDIMIEDTRQLSEYLIKRFNKEKIFILGHSWGSYLGIRTVSKYPNLYYAYIGIGQVTDQRKSEQISYNFVMEQAKKENNTKAIQQLEQIGFPENGMYRDSEKGMMIERNWVMNYGGAAWKRNKADFYKLFILPLFKFKEYSVEDKFNYVRGMAKTQRVLWDPLMNQQISDLVKSVEVPVYILQGKHDYQTSFEMAKIYFDSLQAPRKEFIEFSNSAHMLPYNLEIDKFIDIMNNKIPNEILN